MTESLSRPPKAAHHFRRVAILFAGGPAPAANAVISTAATSFMREGTEVIGMKHGYSSLADYSPARPLVEGRDYVRIAPEFLKRTRSSQGIMLGTARTNPGRNVSSPAHLDDAERVRPLANVDEGLRSLGVEALISIGGDDTLKTANKFKLFQDRLPAGTRRIPVVHLPKTIDNDYMGIDFTFGYFTAVDTLGGEIRNLLYDAEASRGYFVCETMGRSAGWLSYGAAIAGEASLVISVEDIHGRYRGEETVTAADGTTRIKPVMNIDAVVGRIVKTMRVREEQEGKQYGVIVLAEGLAEYLPAKSLEGIPRDDHGHISISHVQLGRMFARLVAEEFKRQTDRSRKVVGLQLGYESRCAKPHAFDVMLGSQLGVGAYRALAERGLDGVMVSVSGQLDLNYVPFEELVDPNTLVTVVRYVERGSDFHALARFLETYVNE
ncbi:MAG TPA: 6-phosphofructokinase [Planctomycetaceae bacterium]|nr:6-phosphofructokinase [Planctomycetaceae bacterium]